MGIVLAFSRSETAAKQREDAQQVSTKKGVDVTLECVSNMQSGLIDGFLGARMEFKERQWSSTYMTHGRCGCQYSMVPELGSFSSVLGSSPSDAGRCSRIVGARSDRESRTSLQELPNLKWGAKGNGGGPKIRVSPNHPFLDGIVYFKPSIFWGTTIYGNPQISKPEPNSPIVWPRATLKKRNRLHLEELASGKVDDVNGNHLIDDVSEKVKYGLTMGVWNDNM